MAGTVSDGTGVVTATVALYPQTGLAIADVVTLNGDQWSYVLDQPVGQYTVWLRFVDAANNQRVVGPFAIMVGSNNAPTADADSAETVENTAVTIPVLVNDVDADSNSLTVGSITQGSNGVVVNNGSDVTYTPNTNFCGADQFTYRASDGVTLSNAATVTLTVTCVNYCPSSPTIPLQSPRTVSTISLTYWQMTVIWMGTRW
ncbi:MAG: Ig-like domain-containing protein [Chloroflexota bacterium]